MRKTLHEPLERDLLPLIRAIVGDDSSEVSKLLKTSPSLAQGCIAVGATRRQSVDFFFTEIAHYIYSGDTPLHAAAAGYRQEIDRALLKGGANVAARKRRGAQPLHYAADGGPGLPNWNPRAQAAMISLLIEAGADPNALDESGVAPLHRAVRQRCPSAVDALLRNGAQVKLKNKTGSTPLHLAVQNTGRGGSGSPGSKTCQKEIIELLLEGGASAHDLNAKGQTVTQSAQDDWKHALL